MTTDKLLQTLQTRFEDHMERHPDWSWDQVQARLQSQPDSLDILAQMEDSGAEPDFVDLGPDQDPHLIYVDLYTKTPKERESLCYDEEARLGRKKFPPESSVQAEVAKTGSQLLDPDQYRALQKVEAIDLKSSV